MQIRSVGERTQHPPANLGREDLAYEVERNQRFPEVTGRVLSQIGRQLSRSESRHDQQRLAVSGIDHDSQTIHANPKRWTDESKQADVAKPVGREKNQ